MDDNTTFRGGFKGEISLKTLSAAKGTIGEIIDDCMIAEQRVLFLKPTEDNPLKLAPGIHFALVDGEERELTFVGPFADHTAAFAAATDVIEEGEITDDVSEEEIEVSEIPANDPILHPFPKVPAELIPTAPSAERARELADEAA